MKNKIVLNFQIKIPLLKIIEVSFFFFNKKIQIINKHSSICIVFDASIDQSRESSEPFEQSLSVSPYKSDLMVGCNEKLTNALRIQQEKNAG